MPSSSRFVPAIVLAACVSGSTGAGCEPVSSSSGASGPPALDGGGAPVEGGEDARPSPAVDASTCTPGDVATYQPVFHPADRETGACNEGQVTGLFDACFGEAKSDAACTAFRSDKGNAACLHCVLTPDSAPRYGPVLDHGSFVTANVAGCIQLAVGVEAASDAGAAELACARGVQALEGCQLAACSTNCPVHDVASLAAFEGCTQEANSAGCSAYAQASACIDGLADAGGGLAECLVSDFGAFYAAVVPRFCVAPAGASDAGAIPPADATPGD